MNRKRVKLRAMLDIFYGPQTKFLTIVVDSEFVSPPRHRGAWLVWQAGRPTIDYSRMSQLTTSANRVKTVDIELQAARARGQAYALRRLSGLGQGSRLRRHTGDIRRVV